MTEKKIAKIGQCKFSKYCKCGHLKDEHQPHKNKIICSHESCDCIIEFK